MSLGTGGRADKRGNTFENRFLAKLLIRLIKEKLEYIKVEIIGPNSDSIEYIAKTSDGKINWYQCKASNKDKNYWSLADLNSLGIITNAYKIIAAGNENIFRFISPLNYNEIDELCERARTCEYSSELSEYLLQNDKLMSRLTDILITFVKVIIFPLHSLFHMH